MPEKRKPAPTGGFFDNIFKDVLEFTGKPETHSYIEDHIIRPLMVRVFKQLYPYIVGILVLWLLMFVCLTVILLMVLRGSLVGVAGVAAVQAAGWK